jgi:hypothetical protein
MAPEPSYNRFVRCRQAGVWDRIINALAAGHDAAVKNLTSKIHAVVNINGLPACFETV